ncbi:22595_t:CDS:2, partial [Entrophospora sp. SA101]
VCMRINEELVKVNGSWTNKKANKWTANIEHATLKGLKDYIRKMYQPPALENDGVELNLMNDGEKYFPHNDQDLREMLRIFVSKNNLKFTVFIEMPSKAFLDWSFPKVLQDLENDSSWVILRNLITKLEARLKSIPIKKNITGPNGYGPVDFAIDLLQTTKMVGVTEVKDEDFYKGIAQNAVQLESALSNCKRKASEMEEDVFTGKTFGIITDAKEWYFMECLYNEGKPLFKLSKPVTVVYDDEDLQAKVGKVLSHIAWLLEEAQKPDSDSQSEESVIKKHRSSSNLTGKSDK